MRKIFKSLFIFLLVFSWLLTGWPGIRISPQVRFPPKINKAEAAIAYRAVGAEATGTGAVTPALPTGVVANDIVILVASTIAGGSITITANGSITSWTALTGSPIDVTSGEKLYVWWGRYSSGSTGPTVTPGSDHIEAGTIAYSGVITSGSPIDVSATGTETTSDTSLSFATGISTTVDGTKILLVTTNGTDSSTNGKYSSEANTSLTSISERMDYNTSSGGGGGIMVTEGIKATAGTVGTWTATLSSASTKAYISFALKPQNTTTLADGSNPTNTSIGPGGSITDLDVFTLATDNSTDTVNSLTATLSPSGAYDNVDSAVITDNSNNVKCTVSGLTSNTLNFSSCGLSVTTSATTYKIRVTPKSHASMPAPSSGQSYGTTGTITSWTSVNGNTQAGSDAASATVTIDNASPNGATGIGGSGGNAAVTLDWTTSGSSDFNTTSGSVIYRWVGSSAGSEVPIEGSTPSVGDVNGTATVACVISSNSSTTLSKIDGTGGSSGCTTSALSNGQSYVYKVFQKDTNGNYDTGVSMGTFTPALISIAIISGGVVDYGTVALGATKSTIPSDLNITQTVKNDGSGAEDFNIKTTNATGGTQWSLGATIAENIFVHEYSTNGGGAWTKFTTAGSYEATPLVSNVAANGTQNFDLRITVPSSTTDYQQKTIVVTIQAVQH